MKPAPKATKAFPWSVPGKKGFIDCGGIQVLKNCYHTSGVKKSTQNNILGHYLPSEQKQHRAFQNKISEKMSKQTKVPIKAGPRGNRVKRLAELLRPGETKELCVM